MNNIEKYNDILNVLNKHEDLLKINYNLDIRSNLKRLIKAQELALKFNIELGAHNFEANETYSRLGEYISIGLYGETLKRTISWSDDGRQPNNEWLLQISFPTGAYIFGDDYPVNVFNDFFVELKSFNPKYSDSNNHNLYYDENNANLVYTKFKEIKEKYKKLAADEIKKIRIEKLEKELEKMKETS